MQQFVTRNAKNFFLAHFCTKTTPPFGHKKTAPTEVGAVFPSRIYLDLIYGLPFAAGTWDFPTNKISTMTVTTYGIIDTS